MLADLEGFGPVTAVQGNMDDVELRRALPVRTTVELEGLRIGLVHDGGPAHGRQERLRELFAGCDLIAYGHSHMPEVSRVAGTWVVNPGSPTERRRAPSHTVVTIRDGEPHLVVLRA